MKAINERVICIRTYARAQRMLCEQDIREHRQGVLTETYESAEFRALNNSVYLTGQFVNRHIRTVVDRWVIWRTHYWRETGQRL